MLPASNPVRFGMSKIVDRLVADFPATLSSAAG